MPNATTEEFLLLIDEKLEQVLSEPLGWGGIDALEPLVLILLMLRARAVDPTTADRATINAYRAFLARRVEPGASDLRARLGSDGSIARMVEVLREHVGCVRAAMVAPTRFPPPPVDRRIGQEQPATEPHYKHRRAS